MTFLCMAYFYVNNNNSYQQICLLLFYLTANTQGYVCRTGVIYASTQLLFGSRMTFYVWLVFKYF